MTATGHDTLGASGEKALQAIRSARSEVRNRAWSLAGENAPDTEGQVVIDLEGVLVTADHITTAQLALAQIPKKYRRGRQTLIRTDSAGGTHDFVSWLAKRGRWLSHSVGMTATDAIHQHVLKVPASAWTPAEVNSEIRDGACVAELTGDVLADWPQGMRLITRKERPHPD